MNSGSTSIATWDVFISYKSENVNAVRLLAETLMANGLRVWFAEYAIVIGNYDEFEQEIRTGIASSRAFILCTSSRWAASEHCQLESNLIFNTRPTVPIIEVRMTSDWSLSEKMPHKSSRVAASLAWSEGAPLAPVVTTFLDIAAISLKQPLWLPSPSASSPETAKAEVPELSSMPSEIVNLAVAPDLLWTRFNIRIDTSPYRAIDPSLLLQTLPERARTFGGAYIWQSGAFQLTLEIHVFRDRSVMEEPPRAESGDLNDRLLYTMYRRYMRSWMSENRANDLGLHLVVGNGKVGAGFTLRANEEKPNVIERRYILPLKSEKSVFSGEAHLTFTVEGVSSKNEEALSQLTKLTPVMDRITATLKHDGGASSFMQIGSKLIIMTCICVPTFVTWRLRSHLDQANEIVNWSLMFWIESTFLAVDFVAALFYPEVRTGTTDREAKRFANIARRGKSGAPDTSSQIWLESSFWWLIRVLWASLGFLPIPILAAWMWGETTTPQEYIIALAGFAAMAGNMRLMRVQRETQGAGLFSDVKGEPSIRDIGCLERHAPGIVSLIKNLRRQQLFRYLDYYAVFGFCLFISTFFFKTSHIWIASTLLAIGTLVAFVMRKLRFLLVDPEVSVALRAFRSASASNRTEAARSIRHAFGHINSGFDPRFPASLRFQWSAWIAATHSQDSEAYVVAAWDAWKLHLLLESKKDSGRFLRIQSGLVAENLLEHAVQIATDQNHAEVLDSCRTLREKMAVSRRA